MDRSSLNKQNPSFILKVGGMICVSLLAMAFPVETIAYTVSYASAGAGGTAVCTPTNGTQWGTNYAYAICDNGTNYGKTEANATAGTLKGISYSGVENLGAGTSTYVQDTFTVSGPAAGSPITLVAHATLNGSLSAGPSTTSAAGANVNTTIQADWGVPNLSTPSTTQWYAYNLSNTYIGPGFSAEAATIDQVLTITLDATAGSPFGLSYYLNTSAGGIASSNFFGTAQLSFDLPTGTSISSDGGYFQTAVPLPPAVWLFGSGLLGLVGIARRKARPTRTAMKHVTNMRGEVS